MRLPHWSAGCLVLLASRFVVAGDDGPISALAALAPSVALAQTNDPPQAAEPAPPAEKADQKPPEEDKSEAAPERRRRHHRGGHHAEERRRHGQRHHARHAGHHGPGRGRGGDREGRAARSFRFAERRQAGFGHRDGGFRGSFGGRFAHHRRGEGWGRRGGHSFRPVHRQFAMRSFHGPHFSQAAIGGPAFRGSRDSWRPPMAGWFGGNHPSADSPRPAGSDNTAELREQVQRLQEQQERLAHAVRELTEALSRTRRD